MKRFPFLVMMIVALAASCTTTAPDSRQEADLLIKGGTIITISGPNIENGAIAVRDGAIVDVGPSARVESAWRGRDVIDARGEVVMPGLVNAHTHVPMTLFRGIADDRSLMDWLNNYIFPAEAKMVSPEFVRWGTRLGAAEMIESGTTTFADMYYYEADIARETRKAGLRGVLGETLIDFPAPDNKTWADAIAYAKKYVAEFKGDPLITPALAPHAPYTVSAEHLVQVRELADELHVPIEIHLAETQDETKQIEDRYGVRPVEHLDHIGFLGPDVIAAHGIWLDPAELDLLKKRGVGIVHCPHSNMMLADGVAPVPDMLARGMEVGLGTDGPAGSNDDLDMIIEMGSAARLQKITRMNPKALGAKQVLRMATLGGAQVLGLADKIGSIEVGKRADIIILDLRKPRTQPIYDVESTIVYAANGSDVVTTIVDGRILMRDRQVLTVDIPAVLAKAKEYRDQVLAALSKKN